MAVLKIRRRRCGLLADVLGVKDRERRWRGPPKRLSPKSIMCSRTFHPSKRPHVYLARGPEGLETGSRGSINTEIIERVGGNQCGGRTAAERWHRQRVARTTDRLGSGHDRHPRPKLSARGCAAKPNGSRCQRWPQVGFSWRRACPSVSSISPPSLNRLIGLTWLSAHALSRTGARQASRAGAFVLSSLLSGRSYRHRPRSPSLNNSGG